MKEEFNYFCLFDAFPSPPPLKTWTEQLRDGEYTLTTLSPLTSIDGVGVTETKLVLGETALSDDGEYLARLYACTLVGGGVVHTLQCWRLGDASDGTNVAPYVIAMHDSDVDDTRTRTGLCDG